MVSYHIGTLDMASRTILAEGPGEESSSEPRPVFLQSKVWTKAIPSEKKIISADTRIFRFTLEHLEQQIGLPIGKHLMMRLQDPVTQRQLFAHTHRCPREGQGHLGHIDQGLL